VAGRCGLFQLLVAVAGSCGWLRSLVAFAGGLGAGRFTRVPPAQTQNEMAVPLSQVILCPNQLVGGWSAACSCAQGAVIRRLLSPGATESRMGDVGDSDDLEPEEELGRIWIPGRDDGGSGTNTADLRRLQGHRDADIEVARGTFKTLLKEVDAARLDTGQAKRITKAAAAMDKLKQLQSQFVQSAASVDPAKWEKALTLQYRKARQAIKKLKSSGEGGGGGGGGASGGAESTTEGGGSKGAPRARDSAVENSTDWTKSGFWTRRSPEEAEAAVLVLLAQNKDTAFETAATFYTGSPESTSRLVRALAEAKAEVGARDNQGRTPLHSAAALNHGPAESVSALVRALAEAKAEVGARDRLGQTPLHHAAAKNTGPAESLSALVRALAEVKAEVGARDGYGRTPLHLVFTGDLHFTDRVLALANALLEAKAEVGAADNQGQTPLHFALAYEGPFPTPVSALIYRLLEVKADLLAEDAYGQTPLDISRGCPAEALLVEHLTRHQLAGAVSTSHSAAESSSVAQTLAASDAAELSTTTESAQHSGAASLPGALTSADLPPPRKRKLDSDASGRKRVGQGLKSEVKADMEAEPAEAGESHP